MQTSYIRYEGSFPSSHLRGRIFLEEALGLEGSSTISLVVEGLISVPSKKFIHLLRHLGHDGTLVSSVVFSPR